MMSVELDDLFPYLNVEEIWKKGLIGIRLRKSYD